MLEKVNRKTDSVWHELREKAYASKRGASRIFQPSVAIEVLGNNRSLIQSQIRIIDMSAKGIRLEVALEEPLPTEEHLRIRFIKPELLRNIELKVFIRGQQCIKYNQSHGEPNLYHVGGEFTFPSPAVQHLLVKWSSRELQSHLQRRRSIWKELFSTFFISRVRGWNFHTPNTFQELESSHKLIYQEYRKKNYIKPNRAKTYYRFHDLLPNTWTFVATNKKGQVGGSISLIPYDESYGCPADKVFPQQIEKLLDQGRRVGEVGMLAVNKELFPKNSFVLANATKMKFLFQLYRIMFLHAYHILNLDTLLIMVHPKHISLYNYLYFKQVGSTRTYDKANHAPAVLMYLHLPEVLDFAAHHNRTLHRFFNCEKDLGKLGKKFMPSAQDIAKILNQDRGCGNLTDQERCLLSSMYEDNVDFAA